MKRIVYSLALVLLLAAKLCAIDAEFLGCRPNDPNVDNGEILSRAIADGKVKDTVHFTLGRWYAASTLEADGSIRLEGVTQAIGPRGSVWVYHGPKDHPAWNFRAIAPQVDSLNLLRPEGTRGGTGVRGEWKEGDGPNGKWHLRNLTIEGFDKAVHVAGKNHLDVLKFERVIFRGNGTDFLCENAQSASIVFDQCSSVGTGNIIFDMVRGGNMSVRNHNILDKRLMFRIGRPGSNTCRYEATNFKVDTNAKGSRLVEMTQPHPLYMTLTGHVGQKSELGENPIVLKFPENRPEQPGYEYITLCGEITGSVPNGKGVWRLKAEDYR
jgi:hypothetical protein